MKIHSKTFVNVKELHIQSDFLKSRVLSAIANKFPYLHHLYSDFDVYDENDVVSAHFLHMKHSTHSMNLLNANPELQRLYFSIHDEMINMSPLLNSFGGMTTISKLSVFDHVFYHRNGCKAIADLSSLLQFARRNFQ